MSRLSLDLMMAAGEGDLDAVKTSVAELAAGKSQPALLSALNSALRDAAEYGHLAIVRFLLAAGADVQTYHNAALKVAAERGHLAVVDCLLVAGADVHVGDNAPLKAAAEFGHLAVVRRLLAAGADLHAGSGTALRVAATNGRAAVVQCLLEEGADLGDFEDAAMLLSVSSWHADTVRLLRAHGASLTGILPRVPTYSPYAQVALFEAGDIRELSVIELANLGICPEALHVVITRQGNAELAAMLKSTQMLEPLAPAARAELLLGLLANIRPIEKAPCQS